MHSRAPLRIRKVVAARHATEKELQSVAIVERKVMVAMRDGKRMAADIYRPKDTSKKDPTIVVRTPHNFNFWDVRCARDMKSELEAVKHGYAFVTMNERGHFFSEGTVAVPAMPCRAGRSINARWKRVRTFLSIRRSL